MYTKKTWIRTYYCCEALDCPSSSNKQNSRLLYIQFTITGYRINIDVSIAAYYPWWMKLSRFHKQDNIVTLKRFSLCHGPAAILPLSVTTLCAAELLQSYEIFWKMQKKMEKYVKHTLQNELFLHLLLPKFAFSLTYSYLCTRKMGKSRTACSLGIPQGLTAARVLGCSGAMRSAFPPASLAQLARARDL